jgi:hypothetical protein
VDGPNRVPHRRRAKIVPGGRQLHHDANLYLNAHNTMLLQGHPVTGSLENGHPRPDQATKRWPVERTHARGDQFGKLRWCTDRNTSVVEFVWICLATRSRWAG